MAESESDRSFDPVEATKDLDDRFQAYDGPGSIQLAGPVGYHAFFDNSHGIDFAMWSALHAAVDRAFMELALDADLLREQHGEVTPETAATALETQLQSLYGVNTDHPLFRQLVNEFESTLKEWDEHLDEREEIVSNE